MRRYCQLEFFDLHMYVASMFDDKFKNRFWKKVKLAGSNDCWLWTAAKNAQGQGAFRVHYGRKQDTAYRVSWILEHNTMIPSGMEIMHSCDNPTCVNPKHLILGTHAQNIADMMRKGRHRTDNPKGEDHYFARLTAGDVRDIRESTLSQTELANIYGVAQAHISRIQLRKSWAHIT